MSDSTLAPNEALALRHTNVSNPSVVHSRPSQSSFAASEDYYSLSGSNSSTHSADALARAQQASNHTITRYQTPPSRYRTPQQSRDLLPLQQQQQQQQQQSQNVDDSFRKTPMRGQGKRRMSVEESQAGAADPLLAGSEQPQQRQSAIKRKPVPSTVMENSPNRISPTGARSSVARDIDRERDAPTPGVDDTPYIQFALDQLTRDEEVRGSRRYPGVESGLIVGPGLQLPLSQQRRYEPVPQEERDIAEQSPYDEKLHMEGPPPKNPARLSQSPERLRQQPFQQPQLDSAPNVFVPVLQYQTNQPPLNFVPGLLREPSLGVFMLLLLAYVICLIIAAAWSVSDTGLWNYGSLGDGRYFVFQYLPTILGMILLMWLFEIQKAVYRIAPFIAMASEMPASRIFGPKLPVQPRGFILPYFGHFKAKQSVIGTFLLVAWLQLFTIPLLGSAFNVYQKQGQWKWIATQGVIWVVVALYIILLIGLIVLRIWLRSKTTGLKWDPRSLADMIVLVERSNALDGRANTTEHAYDRVNQRRLGPDERRKLGRHVPQLGYFHASHRPNEVFHTYGIADKPARSYEVVDGQIREKTTSGEYDNAMTSFEYDSAPRYSKEEMLPHHSSDEEAQRDDHSTSPLPWFLRPSLAALWPVIAIVLLLAFLIVSYLPSTSITHGFAPRVPAHVNTSGFSSTNFLYSFIPTLLALLCLLCWMDIDLAYRRLAPLVTLTSGEKSAERTLLTSYPADFPVQCTASALVNGDHRIAFLSAVTLLSTALPALAGGVFWAQFYISEQRVRISAHMPAYYALTVFCVIYALAYLAIYPPRSLRHHTTSPPPSKLESFSDVVALVGRSRILDDVAFRAPLSRVQLVTRLLNPHALPSSAGNGDSKVSLADSVRGFGRARAADAEGEGPKYAFGRFEGRDGRGFDGVDRVR